MFWCSENPPIFISNEKDKVGSRQVEVPLCRGVDPHRARGFGALAQDFGRSAILFLPKYVVPAAKCVSADLLEFAVTEFAEIVSGRKKLKKAENNVGRQTLKEQLCSGSRETTASSIIPTKSAKRASLSRTVISENIFEQWCQIIFGTIFVAVSRNLGGKNPVVDYVLLSHEQKLYPTTSLDENCIEFEFHMDQNYNVDLRPATLIWNLTLSMFAVRKLTIPMKIKKNTKKKQNRMTKQTRSKSRKPMLAKFYTQFFSNVEGCIDNQQLYNSVGPYMHKSYISNNFKEAISETREFCTARGTTTKNFLMRIWKRLCLNLLSQGE